VVGATDRLTPAAKALFSILQGQKDNVELVEFEGCGHAVCEIVPGEFNDAVVDFIDRQVMRIR
jgi:pimeloyl-ACP methyl ester carboxylesterase